MKRYIRLGGGDADTWAELGSLQLALAQTYAGGRQNARARATYAQAVQSYQMVVQLRPGDGDAEFQLGLAASSAGNNHVSVKALEAYLRIEPESPNADQLKQLIADLGGGR